MIDYLLVGAKLCSEFFIGVFSILNLHYPRYVCVKYLSSTWRLILIFILLCNVLQDIAFDEHNTDIIKA